MSTVDVDLVYTWVNGDDPQYLKVHNKYAEKPKDINPERYRDIYQLLKYSLRSVEMHANWIRNIYIVTARPQVPDWLDLSNSRIKIIHHDEIIDEAYLPTFNYNVIESFQHRIDGISEHFISLNDDFLFGNSVSISDFIDEDGRITVFGTLFGENLKFRIYEGKNDIVGLGFVEHNPVFYKKSFVNDLQELHRKKFLQTRNSKFRRKDNVTMQKVYKQYMLSNHKNISSPISVMDLLKIHTFHKIKNDPNQQEKAIAKLEAKQPKFYCLNDDQRDNPNPDVVSLIKDFLERSYPEKSSFEVD